MKNKLILGAITGSILFGGIILLTGNDCPVIAEITDARLGKVIALTKGITGCVKIEDYIIASYKNGEAPVVDISKITKEEWDSALQSLVTLFGIEPFKDKKNLYLAVREKLVSKGEILANTKDEKLLAETIEAYISQ